MKKLLKVIAGILTFIIVSQASSQNIERTAEQEFNAYRSSETLYGLEVREKLDKGEMPDIFGHSSPHIKRMTEAEQTLNVMRASGNPLAAYYAGLIRHSNGVKTAGTMHPNDVTRSLANDYFREAIALFKEAGEGGEPGGFMNTALMYRDGQGVTRSKLAAAEWFYKAGISYLKFGDREHALASLEAINEIDANSVLAKRLKAVLNKGMPN